MGFTIDKDLVGMIVEVHVRVGNLAKLMLSSNLDDLGPNGIGLLEGDRAR